MFISLRGSEAPGLSFGSPASRRCAAGAARRSRFQQVIAEGAVLSRVTVSGFLYSYRVSIFLIWRKGQFTNQLARQKNLRVSFLFWIFLLVASTIPPPIRGEGGKRP